jgi:hypothetical protein
VYITCCPLFESMCQQQNVVHVLELKLYEEEM